MPFSITEEFVPAYRKTRPDRHLTTAVTFLEQARRRFWLDDAEAELAGA